MKSTTNVGTPSMNLLFLQMLCTNHQRGVLNKSSWWAALTNKPRVCPHICCEGGHVPLVFPEKLITSTMEISTALPELLVDNSNVDDKAQVVDIESTGEEEPNDVDSEYEPEWDDLETNMEDDETQIHYHFNDDDDNDDVEGGTDEDNDY